MTLRGTTKNAKGAKVRSDTPTAPSASSRTGTGKVRLGDVAAQVRGVSYKPSDASEQKNTDNVPLLRANNITENGLVLEDLVYVDAAKVSENQYLLSGDILVCASSGSKKVVGKACFIESETTLTFGAFCKVVRPKANLILPKYLAQYFQSPIYRAEISRLANGASINNIRSEHLDNLEFPLPPLPTQQRIADELDQLCALKKNAEDRLAILDQIVKSRFAEMFGDVEINPHGFEVKRLDDVCLSIIRGPFGSALKKEFFIPKSDKAYKVYEQKHAIQKSEKIGSYYVSEEKFKELSRFECRPGDIIMSCSGTMGEFFQLPESCEKGVMNQALCKFTLGNKVSPVYFLAFMSREISKLQTQGSGIKNIAAVSYVKALKFVLPPLALQREFAAFVAEVDKSKVTLRETVATLDQLYRAKLQECFG